MKKVLIFFSIFTLGCFACNKDDKSELQNLDGNIEIHRCFCDPSAYRYLITVEENNKKFYYNPVNLSEDYRDENYKIVFSADLLKDSSIIYENTETDEVIESFRARNIRLTNIRKCSNLVLNDTFDAVYGRVYSDYKNKISIKLDSVLSDSRCPEGAECFWEGNANALFDFGLMNKQYWFSLNTHAGFTRDTLIGGFEIKMLSLSPVPSFSTTIPKNVCTARMIILK